MCAQLLSCVWLFVTPWTGACQIPLSMGFPRQEYWSGLTFLLQGIFLTQGLNPSLLHWQADFLSLSHQGSPARKQTFINPEDAFPRTQPHWHLDPGHPSLQNCEREMSNVCCLSPWSFVGSLKWWRWSLAAPTLCDSETLNSLSIRNKGAPPLHL